MIIERMRETIFRIIVNLNEKYFFSIGIVNTPTSISVVVKREIVILGTPFFISSAERGNIIKPGTNIKEPMLAAINKLTGIECLCKRFARFCSEKNDNSSAV